ncbi:MAG: FtsX-like permease family protein [Paludibacter sp.]
MRKLKNNNLFHNSPFGGWGAIFKTAFRSLIGNGLKTWLNVFVLSISFVLIIILQGILKGWSNQAVDDTVKWEIAGGEYWQSKYDPFDPFTFDSSTVEIPAVFKKDVDNRKIEPILLTQGSIYPQGRMQGVLLKGIRPDQKLLQIPTQKLIAKNDEIPVVLGAFMAKQTKLHLNDLVTLRWRDKNGTFEAADIRVVGIFKTSIPTVDNGILWIPLDRLQKMTMNTNCANLLIKSPELKTQTISSWEFKSVEKLTESTMMLVKAKSVGTSFMYIIFLLLAMLAIFDTQTLSIFRRQREIGTFIALGMTKRQVVWHFTLEGTINAILAFAVGTIWGAPIMYYMVVYGYSFNMDASEIGVPMADTMYATITPGLVINTMIFILIVTAIVSYLPARKIAKMNPTDAIKGKVK